MTASTIDLIALAVFAAALLAAAFTDLRHYLIPNRYPAAIAAAYLLHAVNHPLADGLWGLGIASIFFVVGAGLFATRVMGGGDVKLMAACALWAGPQFAAPFLQITTFAGAALALIWLTPMRRLLPSAPGASIAEDGPRRRLKEPVPYGLAITAGGLYLAALHALT